MASAAVAGADVDGRSAAATACPADEATTQKGIRCFDEVEIQTLHAGYRYRSMMAKRHTHHSRIDSLIPNDATDRKSLLPAARYSIS